MHILDRCSTVAGIASFSLRLLSVAPLSLSAPPLILFHHAALLLLGFCSVLRPSVRVLFVLAMDMKKSMAAHYKQELASGKIRGTGRALTAEERALRFATLRARAEFLRGRYRKELLDELDKLEEAGVQPVQEEEEPAQEQQVQDRRKRRMNEAVEVSAAKKVSKKGMSAIEGPVESIGLGGFRDRQCAPRRTPCEARGPGSGGVGKA
jgi:hypothetical protein